MVFFSLAAVAQRLRIFLSLQKPAVRSFRLLSDGPSWGRATLCLPTRRPGGFRAAVNIPVPTFVWVPCSDVS